MNTQELIAIAVKAGYEITEYEGHYSIKKTFEVIVTVPKVSTLVAQLAERIKALLGLG